MNPIEFESCHDNAWARAEINNHCGSGTFISIVMRELFSAGQPMSFDCSHGHGLEITMVRLFLLHEVLIRIIRIILIITKAGQPFISRSLTWTIPSS